MLKIENIIDYSAKSIDFIQVLKKKVIKSKPMPINQNKRDLRAKIFFLKINK